MLAAILHYAAQRGLTIREVAQSYLLYVPNRSGFLIEITLVKDEDIHEWFVSILHGKTGEILFSDWYEHYDASTPELRHELEEEVKGFIEVILHHELRLTAGTPEVLLPEGWSRLGA